MKRFLLILVLSSAVFAQRPLNADSITDWVKIGGNDEGVVFYSPSSIVRSGDRVNVYLKIEMPNGSEFAGLTKGVYPEYYSGIGYATVQCKESRVTGVSSVKIRYYYQDGSLARIRKESESVQSEAWKPLLDRFCETGSDAKPTTAPTLKPRSSTTPADTAPKSDVESTLTGTIEHPARKP